MLNVMHQGPRRLALEVRYSNRSHLNTLIEHSPETKSYSFYGNRSEIYPPMDVSAHPIKCISLFTRSDSSTYTSPRIGTDMQYVSDENFPLTHTVEVYLILRVTLNINRQILCRNVTKLWYRGHALDPSSNRSTEVTILSLFHKSWICPSWEWHYDDRCKSEWGDAARAQKGLQYNTPNSSMGSQGLKYKLIIES